jgi:hypothetical protein
MQLHQLNNYKDIADQNKNTMNLLYSKIIPDPLDIYADNQYESLVPQMLKYIKTAHKDVHDTLKYQKRRC